MRLFSRLDEDRGSVRLALAMGIAAAMVTLGYPYAGQLLAEPAPAPAPANHLCCAATNPDCCGCQCYGTPFVNYYCVKLNVALGRKCISEDGNLDNCLEQNDICFAAQAIQLYGDSGPYDPNNPCATNCITPGGISAFQKNINMCYNTNPDGSPNTICSAP